MRKNEAFALDTFLCEYPKGFEYEGVLDLVEKEDRDSITVWEPFEHHVGEAMCEVINDMLYSLDRVYPETKQKSELKITVYRGCVESVKQDGKDINYTLNDLDINT